jgi:hypothetical protein
MWSPTRTFAAAASATTVRITQYAGTIRNTRFRR